MILGNIFQSIYQSHKPPTNTTSPEIRRMASFRISPALATVLIPCMIIKSGLGIVCMLMAESELFNSLINPFRTIKFSSISSHKRRSHIQSIQPHLIGIYFFMPKTSICCTRLLFQLIYQILDSQFIFLLFGFIV